MCGVVQNSSTQGRALARISGATNVITFKTARNYRGKTQTAREFHISPMSWVRISLSRSERTNHTFRKHVSDGERLFGDPF